MKIQTGVIHLLWLMGALVVPAIVQQPIVATSPAPVKIIDYGGGGWKDGQVNEPCILVNPKDSSKLIMFYSGMKLGGSAGAIGKAWANVSEPFVGMKTPGTRFSPAILESPLKNRPFATPAIYSIQNRRYLYFQAAHSGYYIKQHWALWGMECDDLLKTISAYE
jgi:hypothetical protein